MSDRPSGSVRSSDVELEDLRSNVPKYQPLTAEIDAPNEWPVDVARPVFVDVVRMAIKRHLSGRTVIVTVGKVSGLVAKNETCTKYLLEKTEDLDDEEVYKFELLVPAKVEMFSLDLSSRKSEPESVQLLPINLKAEHPVSRMFVTRPDRHKVLTVVPNIEKILKLKGITGPEAFSHVLKLTFVVQGVGWLDDSEPQQEPEPTSAGPSVSAKRVADRECEVVCFERAMAPRRRWLTCRTVLTWTFLVLGLVSLVLLIYYLALGINKH